MQKLPDNLHEQNMLHSDWLIVNWIKPYHLEVWLVCHSSWQHTTDRSSSACPLASKFKNCTWACRLSTSLRPNCRTRHSSWAHWTALQASASQKIRSRPRLLGELCKLNRCHALPQICAPRFHQTCTKRHDRFRQTLLLLVLGLTRAGRKAVLGLAHLLVAWCFLWTRATSNLGLDHRACTGFSHQSAHWQVDNWKHRKKLSRVWLSSGVCTRRKTRKFCWFEHTRDCPAEGKSFQDIWSWSRAATRSSQLTVSPCLYSHPGTSSSLQEGNHRTRKFWVNHSTNHERLLFG